MVMINMNIYIHTHRKKSKPVQPNVSDLCVYMTLITTDKVFMFYKYKHIYKYIMYY